ncbi:SIMPL domain-containing protein [Flavobacterium subsaxonicum]|uniref:SIMPL domain-containing protein n=1 Tax=Flavobacterium subsaxonicum WB 4.1-42 = DSM 21790 TaxID=1121898 RepID=A0A0A2MN10_9FLAO|nr:SIMPL domain-containing protein [Flavobacterium subsaxonicum]KGO92868.1 hypothetical protein Q766_09530 [Flavobacterium subsaxonicum WB 4.1-42 = DSM 21790]
MKKLFTLLALALTLATHAQAVQQEDKPYIEVTGTAQKEVVPDIIYITITLKDKVVNKDSYTIIQQETKLKQALQQAGIDLKKMSLSDASSDIIMYKRKEKGVEEMKEYTLIVNNATEVSKVFETLHNINIKEAEISKTEYSQIYNLRKEVRISAIKAAKDKATYLLEAIGEQPGKPLVINELGSNFSAPKFGSNVALPSDYVTNYTDSFKPIKIEFSYYVKYAIK